MATGTSGSPACAREHLLASLRPLGDQDDLVHTLEQYVAAGGRRKETAHALHVHPNTLDYRLRRVADLVGTDPTCPHGLAVLRAALLARDYVAGGGAAPEGRGRLASGVTHGTL